MSISATTPTVSSSLPRRASRARCVDARAVSRRGRDVETVVVSAPVSSSSSDVSSSSDALGRRGAIAATTTSIAFALATAREARAGSSGTMCGYFDDFGGGLVPKYAFDTPWNEGTIDGATWVRGVGDYKKAKKAKNAPVLAVSNGPGVSHEYMSALETLSGEVGGAREVFLYDQRGCGKSANATSYDLNLYVNEIKRVAEELGVGGDGGGAHVVAHGYWGARLATELALDERRFVKTLTLVSPTASRANEVRDWRRALDAMSPATRDAAIEYEEDLDPARRDAYEAAVREFSERFVSRRGRTGACFTDALAPKSSDAQRRAITGGRYFTLGGSLADDAIDVDGLGERLRRNGVRSARVVRGAEDATSAASVREIVDAMNAGSADGAFCAYDEVENAGSCVFLDRADYFYETLDIVVEKSDA